MAKGLEMYPFTYHKMVACPATRRTRVGCLSWVSELYLLHSGSKTLIVQRAVLENIILHS